MLLSPSVQRNTTRRRSQTVAEPHVVGDAGVGAVAIVMTKSRKRRKKKASVDEPVTVAMATLPVLGEVVRVAMPTRLHPLSWQFQSSDRRYAKSLGRVLSLETCLCLLA